MVALVLLPPVLLPNLGALGLTGAAVLAQMACSTRGGCSDAEAATKSVACDG